MDWGNFYQVALLLRSIFSSVFLFGLYNCFNNYSTLKKLKMNYKNSIKVGEIALSFIKTLSIEIIKIWREVGIDERASFREFAFHSLLFHTLIHLLHSPSATIETSYLAVGG